MVVMQGTPWLTAEARIRPSSVRAPLPLGVLTIRAIAPLARWSSRFGPALVDLADGRDRDPVLGQRGGGAAGAHQRVAQRREPRGDRDDRLAVAGGDADEDRARSAAAGCWPPIWLLANAAAKSGSIPITSPVERISGPSTMSTPGNFANGKTDSFTETYCGTGSAVIPCSVERLARPSPAPPPGPGSGRSPSRRTARSARPGGSPPGRRRRRP